MILVTGGAGQLGTAFRKVVPEARFVDLADFDLTRADALAAALSDLSPEAIVNCAAYTAVDRAEQEEARATEVNGSAVGVMASYAAVRGIPFLTFSTDYVFPGDGTTPYLESSPTAPVNRYVLSGDKPAVLARSDGGGQLFLVPPESDTPTVRSDPKAAGKTRPAAKPEAKPARSRAKREPEAEFEPKPKTPSSRTPSSEAEGDIRTTWSPTPPRRADEAPDAAEKKKPPRKR